MVKKKNIHILSTDKPSRLHLAYDKDYYLSVEPFIQLDTKNYKSFNIYITNDEGIKEGDWGYSKSRNKICKVTGISKWTHKDDYSIDLDNENYFIHHSYCKKIILTTDQDLIKDSVQAIDDEFLKWFVKNPSCESVEVDDWIDTEGNIAFGGDKRYQICTHLYNKIIMPQEEQKQHLIDIMRKGALEPKEYKQIKCYCGHTNYCDCGPLEEPKQEEDEIIDISDHDGIGNAVDNLNNTPPQETLEEVAERLYSAEWDWKEKESFIEGAEWQAGRMYSEEDMIKIVEKSRETGLTAEYLLLTEQFKKK